MSKCQVKDCENEAMGFVCQHEDGDHEICQECVDKYFTSSRLVARYVVNRGWMQIPSHIPTIPHTTEHGDEVQVVEEEEYERYELRG